MAAGSAVPMFKNRKTIAAVAMVLILVVASAAIFALQRSPSRLLITYSADAYVLESNYLLNSFHNSTGYGVAPAVGGGSFSSARLIGQGAPADILISVSLEAYTQAYLKGRYSGWAMAFAADQLVIAYSNATLQNSQAQSIITLFKQAYSTNATNSYFSAFDNLTSGKVKVGIANPADDPAGLRGWLALEIAGYLFAGGNTSYFTDEIASSGGYVSAVNAAELVAPLETGNIQFLLTYRSAALSSGLHYIALTPQLNQGSTNLTAFYYRFTYKLPTGIVHGAPIYLFMSVLANSSNANAAYSFLDFVVNSTQLMARFGMIPLTSPLMFYSSLPPRAAALLDQGRVAYGGRL